jgi:hypothetical protein
MSAPQRCVGIAGEGCGDSRSLCRQVKRLGQDSLRQDIKIVRPLALLGIAVHQ